MAWLKIFSILLVCFRGLDTSSLTSSKYPSGRMVRVPVVTSALSSRYPQYVEIPKECEELGFCENPSSYPEEVAQKLIRTIKETFLFSNIEENLSIESRFKYTSGQNPCPTIIYTEVKPKLALYNNEWYYILNTNNDTITRFRGEKCANENQELEDLLLVDGYDPKCIQKYLSYHMIAILDERPTVLLFNIPATCSCVAIENTIYTDEA